MSVKKNYSFEKEAEIPSPIATFLFYYLSITLITSVFHFMYTRTHGRLQIFCVF